MDSRYDRQTERVATGETGRIPICGQTESRSSAVAVLFPQTRVACLTVTPEQKAREEIDRQLAACGWIVQDPKAMNIMAGLGVAVREFPLKTGFADYLLYVDG